MNSQLFSSWTGWCHAGSGGLWRALMCWVGLRLCSVLCFCAMSQSLQVAVTLFLSLGGWLCLCQNGASEMCSRHSGQRTQKNCQKWGKKELKTSHCVNEFSLKSVSQWPFNNIALLLADFCFFKCSWWLFKGELAVARSQAHVESVCRGLFKIQCSENAVRN